MRSSVKILPILLIAAQANADDICSIHAPGETQKDARQKATESLAMTIKSKVVFNSKSEETIEGRISSQKDFSTQEVYSELRNQHAVKYKDEFFSMACISSEDAAKPYLNDSRVLASKLENALIDLKDISEKSGKKETWEKVNAIYKELKDLEVILASLNQANTDLQRKYNSYYNEAKKEYTDFVSRLDKGIYVESSDLYLKNRISTLLSSDCILAEKEMAALKLKLDIEEDKKLAGGIAYCYVDIGIELKGSKIQPYTYHTTKPEKEGGIDMERACKDATEKSVDKIWNQLKREIIKGGCK